MIISPSRQLVDAAGVSTTRTQLWTEQVTDLQMMSGSGSPEGVIVATEGRLYMNTAGTVGSILYVKRDADISGDRSQGWILV